MLRGSCGSSLRAHGGVPSRPKHLTKGFNSSAAVAAGSGARARLEGNTCSRRPGKSISGTKAPQTGRRAASRSASLSLTVLCSSQERSQTRHLKADTNAPHAHPRQRCGGVGACMSDPHLHLHLALQSATRKPFLRGSQNSPTSSGRCGTYLNSLHSHSAQRPTIPLRRSAAALSLPDFSFSTPSPFPIPRCRRGPWEARGCPQKHREPGAMRVQKSECSREVKER
jgi:hypothetical protein